MTLRAAGRVAGSKNVAPKKDMGMMTKLLYKPTLSSDRTFKPTITPNPEKTAQFSISNNRNKGLRKLHILPVNSTATKITEPEVINPRTIPASILPRCRAKGCMGTSSISSKVLVNRRSPQIEKVVPPKLIVIDDSATMPGKINSK